MTTAEWVGTLRFVDVGAGAWVLEGGRDSVALYGAVPPELCDRRVRVTGRRVEIVTYGMPSGVAIEAESVVPAEEPRSGGRARALGA